MRATWIFFALAAATLVFVMLLRPGGPGEEGTRFEPAPSEERAPARLPPPESVATEAPLHRESADRSGQDLVAEVDPRSEDERPAGGYDATGRAFHDSEDYHALAREIVDAAADGSASSQYYLYRILSECRLAVRQFDGEFPDQQALAAALPDELNPGVNDLMQQQVARCRGFFEDDPARYGQASEWLARAAEAGYGPAVAQQSLSEFQQHQAGRDSNFDPTALVEALRERNPETLAHASQLSALAGAPQSDESAWLMLACQYGQDCSGEADWVRALCLQEGCPPGYDDAEDVLSILLTPGELEQARDRMGTLEEALDEGDFDGLFR